MTTFDRITNSSWRILSAATSGATRAAAKRRRAWFCRLAVLAAMGLGGCAQDSPLVVMTDAVLGTTPQPQVKSADHLWATDPILAYIADATPDETGTVADPVNGYDVWVEAGRRFHAASGHLCRRYRIVTPSDPGATRYGLACRDDDGHWYRSTLNVNPLAPSSRREWGLSTGDARS